MKHLLAFLSEKNDEANLFRGEMICCQPINIWIAVAILGFIAGISASPMFAFEFKNFNAAIFALISSLLALALVILHVKHKHHTLTRWLEYLPCLKMTAFFVQMAAAVFFVIYIVLAIVRGQNLSKIRGENLYIACVWIWMTWKWSFSIFWFSRKYKLICDERLIVDQDNQS
uniref:Uncharacterized protein n=1 Tax=Romanomermis culicivorax TaxID=13658 RepID=A0A915JCV3_ROMCU